MYGNIWEKLWKITENGVEMFCFSLPSTLNRFPIWHQMKTIALENTISFTQCRFHMNISFTGSNISIPFRYKNGLV